MKGGSAYRYLETIHQISHHRHCWPVFTAVGFNLFLIHHQLLSGGFSGIAMMIGYFTGWDIGLLYLLLNIPVLLWGYFAIGKFFVLLSMLSVLITSWLLQVIPINLVTDTDLLIGAVFGGVISGIGIGITLRAGGSTAGFDIIGSIVTQRYDVPLGSLLSVLNGLIIIIHGYLTHDWNLSLYSLISIYVTGKIVDMIHVRHIKITAFIITNEKDRLLAQLLQRAARCHVAANDRRLQPSTAGYAYDGNDTL